MSCITDELRAMLDERGVEHFDGTECTLWGYEQTSDSTGCYRCAADEVSEGFMTLRMHHLTPEQAIAATLGRGTCHDIGYRMDSTRFKCSQCGWDGWVRHAKDGRDYKPLWCPLCGAKVVDE